MVMTLLVGSAQPAVQNDNLWLTDLTGRKVDPFAGENVEVMVFLFVRTDCPISNRYAPEIKRLSQTYANDRIRFRLIYPGADETVAAIEQHIRAYQYSFDVLRDPEHVLVRHTGAQVTPEAVVYVPAEKGWRMLYRGRIDDRFVAFGKMRPAPTVRDLAQVLAAVRKGKYPQPKTTTAIGCFIS